jgi:MFS family permease
VFPLLKASLSLNQVQLALAGSAFIWAYALFGPVAGLIGDRVSRKWVIVAALTFWSCFTALSGAAQNFWELVLCRALAGFGEAFYFPAAMSLISDYHGGATRSRAMSLHQSGVYAGTIAGGALAGWFGEHYGWRAPFGWFGGLGIGLAATLALSLREPQRGAAEHKAEGSRLGTPGEILAEVLRNPAALLLIGAFIGANFVAVVFLTWTPSFLHDKFSMNLSMAGWSATAYLQTASVLGVFTGGIAADRFARGRRGARIAVQAFGLACGAPFVFLTGWTLSVPLLILAMTCFGYFKGLYDANIFAGLYDVVRFDRRAAAAGLLNSLGWLGAGFGPLLVGLLSSSLGMSACLSATAVIYLLCAALLANAARRGQQVRLVPGGAEPIE